jgi:hypothetical protein
MAERFWNTEVFNVDITKNELVIRRKKREAGKVTDLLTTFFVLPGAQIKDKAGKDLKLSDVKPGSKVTMDYLKESDGKLAAAIIRVSG